MASQNSGNSKNVSGFNGIKTLRASTAETFKSVDQMRQRKGRLQNLTQEQFEEITNELQSRLYNVIETIDNENSAGAVYVDGKTWSARSENGEPIAAGAMVRVKRMEGVRLFVEELKEEYAVPAAFEFVKVEL